MEMVNNNNNNNNNNNENDDVGEKFKYRVIIITTGSQRS